MKLREWTLHEEIGRGGMGIVYRATHDIVPGNHAIKAVKPELLSDGESRQRFLQEAALVARLRHANIVTADMPFEQDGQLYLPMELLAGQALDVALDARPGPWPVAAAVRIVAQAAAGLGFAHRQTPAVLHRDVKPGNLQLAPDGTVKVLDFGLAKAVGDKSVTAAGLAVGTPAFIAPEVLNGERASPSGDVYALGVVLFRLLTGKLPIDLPADTSSIMAVLMSVSRAHEAGLPTVASLRPDVPAALSGLVARCLGANAAQRPVDGQALCEALTGLGQAPAAPAAPAPASRLGQTHVQLPTRGKPAPPAVAREPVGGRTGVALPHSGARAQPMNPSTEAPPEPVGSGSNARWLLAVLAMVAVFGGMWWANQSGGRTVAYGPAAPTVMVEVPGGPFQMGDKKSLHTVEVAGFKIDTTEVTVAAYAECVTAGQCTKPDSDSGYDNWGKADRAQHPVNSVDWHQATAYCTWKGKRLPTEQEWEKAARGTDGRIYPWGNQAATCDLAVMNKGGLGCGRESTWPVGSKPAGASPYGALNMSGNVWEWTSDGSSQNEKHRVNRGGSWGGEAQDLRASYRDPGVRRQTGSSIWGSGVRSRYSSEHLFPGLLFPGRLNSSGPV